MRSVLSSIVPLCALLAGLGACNPYSPNLGPTPFLCGSSDPKCPDGYTCVSSGNQMVCAKGGTAPDGGSSGMCANDSAIEGSSRNDTTATAYVTPVDTQQASIPYSGLAICPAGDKDYYSVTISSTKSLDANVVYESWGGALTGAILNASGNPIATMSPVSGSTNTIDAYVASVSPGMYYVEVYASSQSQPENNYTLKITAQ